ncbi:MAG: D-alanine--D-alanine ligase [Ignavibacteriales bacterium]
MRDALAEYHQVHLIEANTEAFEKLNMLKPDLVFNIAEGMHGISREAQIPAILDMLQIPYTGSDPLTLSICLDKARTKEILKYHNIPTADFQVISSLEELNAAKFSFPLFIKPNGEGSSKGIFNASLAHNTVELIAAVEKIINEYHQPALVEQYLSGREFTVALMGNGDEVETLPIVEINFQELPTHLAPVYSYEAKWIFDTKENPLDIFTCPAQLDDELKNNIETICKKAYKVLRCRDWSRIDVRLDSAGIPNIIEINPLPGILPNPEDNSCFPKAARSAGMNYQTLINRAAWHGAKRYGLA